MLLNALGKFNSFKRKSVPNEILLGGKESQVWKANLLQVMLLVILVALIF